MTEEEKTSEFYVLVLVCLGSVREEKNALKLTILAHDHMYTGTRTHTYTRPAATHGGRPCDKRTSAIPLLSLALSRSLSLSHTHRTTCNVRSMATRGMRHCNSGSS